LPSDSNKTVLTFTWTDPKYATDSSKNKYIIQIDSAGRNFSKATSKEVIGKNNLSITGKELNNMLLGYGFAFGMTYNMEARLISSYGNNNDRQVSTSVPIKMTPYKTPPKVDLPTSGKLFIIGSATALTNPTDGGWKNPVPVPVQELTRIDETTFGGVFNLEGGGEYLILPVNGSWDAKYAVADGSIPGLNAGGDFGFNVNNSHNSNFPGPAVAGWYKIILDFQNGKFTVTNVNSTPVTDSLYTIGDATAGQWDNANSNTLLKSQYLTRLNSSEFEGTQTLFGGKNLKLISKITQWQPQFGKGANEGDLGYNYGGGSDPNTISIPSDGSYKVRINFLTMKYTVTKQ
jgi:hypothetical protein